MKRDDLSRSLVAFDQASTLIAVVELSKGSWLVGGLVPNLSRQPLKKLRPDPDAVLRLLLRWRATKTGSRIKRMVVAFEAGRDRFATQTADRLVALRHDRRSPGRCRPAFGNMSEL
jgi:transposase